MEPISDEICSQAVLLLSCVGLGGWLMLCYDILRIGRLMFSRPSWLISLEDLGYWIYVSLSAFSLLYRQNDGILRGYVIAGMFLGMVGYDRIISRNVMKFLQKWLGRIKINYNKWKCSRRKVYIKSGDADEDRKKAVPDAQAGQVGEQDGSGGHYGGGDEPGCGGQSKGRLLKRKGPGVSG
ncbi:MAG: spore cortex biosynthesis protein YabQ [Lachnospiraceae bacterium]|nr:spore cortex biosynthesis protein YabQ [Lachnospiraceae bacterium]